MSDVQLDLTDVRPVPVRVPATRLPRLTLLLLLVCVLQLGWLVWQEQRRSAEPSGGALLAGESLRELALQLESLDLHEAAAAAWSDYVGGSRMSAEKAAKLWYRIGTVQQRGRRFAEAAASYCRSQALGRVAELEPEIARRTQECLLALGRAGALRRDMRQRTDYPPSTAAATDRVLAEIGAWKVTRHELELALEEQVEAGFGPFAAGAGGEGGALGRRKAELLKELARPENLQRQLQQFVVQELLCREARAARLDETAEYRAFLHHVERDLLSRRQLDLAVPAPALPSEAECRSHFEAHRADFSRDGQPLEFAAAAPAVTEKLQAERRQQAQQAYCQRLLEKYDVVFHQQKSEPQP